MSTATKTKRYQEFRRWLASLVPHTVAVCKCGKRAWWLRGTGEHAACPHCKGQG